MINLNHFHNKTIKFLFFLIIIFLLGCNVVNEDNTSNRDININDISFPEKTISGENFDISEFKGNNILINFWFPSCPPCVYELEILKKIDNDFDSTSVVGIQMLGLDTKDDGIKMLKNKNISYPSVADEKDEIVLDLNITVFPTSILFNEKGKEIKRWIGIINEEDVEKQLQEIRKD